MSILAFLPWLSLKESIVVGEFELVPYLRDLQPAGQGTQLQGIIDRVLAPYHFGDQPIGSATLIRIDNTEFIRDFTEEERAALFILCELLAISGLAVREYFAYGGYQNRDNFRLVIQAFAAVDGGAAITSRRRDGSSTNYWDEGSYKVQKPEHIPLGTNRIDHLLLDALVQARDSKHWERIYEALLSFNLANTDNAEVSEHIEAVLLTGAFERLFDCRRGKENELAKQFTRVCSPSQNLALQSCSALANSGFTNRFKMASTIREMWIRDFFRLRSNLAHGKIESRYTPVWSLRNHLLLASYVFPLALKCELATLGFYAKTETDQEAVDLFEPLTCEDHFRPVLNRHNPREHLWNKVRKQAAQNRMRKKLAEELEKLRKQGKIE